MTKPVTYLLLIAAITANTFAYLPLAQTACVGGQCQCSSVAKEQSSCCCSSSRSDNSNQDAESCCHHEALRAETNHCNAQSDSPKTCCASEPPKTQTAQVCDCGCNDPPDSIPAQTESRSIEQFVEVTAKRNSPDFPSASDSTSWPSVDSLVHFSGNDFHRRYGLWLI